MLLLIVTYRSWNWADWDILCHFTQQAGAAAAFTIDLLIYPLDTIKTRYQSQDYLKTYAKSSSGISAAATKQASSTVFRGLYQGVGSVIVATLPAGKQHLWVSTPAFPTYISGTIHVHTYTRS